MCFPVLFPSGKFGITHQLNSPTMSTSNLDCSIDSRFRKNPQYVFYLLWQKEMRELSAGVYNLLKSTRMQHVSSLTVRQGKNF